MRRLQNRCTENTVSVYREEGDLVMFTSDLTETILLSVKIGLFATFFNLPLALAGAYFLERVEKRWKSLFEGLINLPLVMPPVTTGYVLLFLLGKRGVFGSFFYNIFGFSIAYTGAAAVLASMIVSYPLIIRSIRISMEMVDPRLEQAAMTLGASSAAVFLRVTLPLVLPGIINGIVLGFARSLVRVRSHYHLCRKYSE